MPRLVFVLEETRGHAAHARNIERTLAASPDIAATVIRLVPGRDRWPSRVPVLGSWSFQASWATRRALQRRLRAEPADAIFIHTQVASLLAADIMRSVPTVVSLDATPINFDEVGREYGHQRGADAVERLKWQVNRATFSKAAALVAWSHWAAKSLVRDYTIPSDRVHVIRPGVDVELFRPGQRPDRSPARLLFVGGDFTRKGGDDLLKAVGSLGETVELDIVSNSPVQPPPGIVCRTHPNLTPQSPALVDLYRRADVFVLPSRSECFGISVSEALACGLPVVASPVGAIPEMVHEGINGHLVPPSDPGALATALRSLVAEPERRLRMGRQSRALAMEEHDAHRNNRAIFELMLSATRPRRPRPE